MLYIYIDKVNCRDTVLAPLPLARALVARAPPAEEVPLTMDGFENHGFLQMLYGLLMG